MRRHRLRLFARVVLVVWTLSASLAAAQICLEATELHYGGARVSNDRAAAGAVTGHGDAGQTDEDCPILPKAIVESGQTDASLDLLSAFASATSLPIQPFADAPALRAGRHRTAAFPSIPAYLAAHRLRF